MTSAKTIRHIRALHAQGCSVADIHLIAGVCADTIRGILTAPAGTTPVPPACEHPDPMDALFDPICERTTVMSTNHNPADATGASLLLVPPILIVATHMGGLLATPMQTDAERQRRRIETVCGQCGDSDTVVATCRTWGELDLELMALAGDGWASDELTGIAKQAALRYCPQVDEETVGELAARLCARAAQWWDDNDTWEDEA